jgi:hypothetical protein
MQFAAVLVGEPGEIALDTAPGSLAWRPMAFAARGQPFGFR